MTEPRLGTLEQRIPLGRRALPRLRIRSPLEQAWRQARGRTRERRNLLRNPRRMLASPLFGAEGTSSRQGIAASGVKIGDVRRSYRAVTCRWAGGELRFRARAE